MKPRLALAIIFAALVCASPAAAHETPGKWETQVYCGYGDGGFTDDGWFDRYQDTVIVTPGAAPWEPNQWHAVFHVYAHFRNPYGWQYTDARLCRWGWW
jgi:hypothetical protein